MIRKESSARTSIRIKPLIYEKFRNYCVRHRSNQTTVIEDALERFLVCLCRCCKGARREV